jgi:hypothetical protein
LIAVRGLTPHQVCLGTTTRSKASLVAISAVLRWRHDRLTNILSGQPEKNVHVRPPALASLERIMHEEIDPLRQQLASLAETVQQVNTRLNLIDAIVRRAGTRTKE